MGDGGDHASAAARPPRSGARHGGGGPGLVDEDHPLRVQRRRRRAPGAPGGGDIWAVRRGGVRGLFFRVRPQAMRKRLIADGLTSMPSVARPVFRSAMVGSGGAATLRSRRSTEYGRAIHGWPPASSSQFESQQRPRRESQIDFVRSDNL
jgi:hypothetical protein